SAARGHADWRGSGCGRRVPGRHGAHWRPCSRPSAPSRHRPAARSRAHRQPPWRFDFRRHRGFSRLRRLFAVLGSFGAVVALAAFVILRGVVVTKPAAPFSLPNVVNGFRGIFADPRAKICFGSVFLEAVFIQGLFPYVAILLLASGESSASIAGIVIAAFGLGGLTYSMSVPLLLARVPERRVWVIRRPPPRRPPL